MEKPKRELILELKYSANDNLFSRPTEDTLGGRIKTARDACHLTVAQLARRINVLSKTLRSWERDCSKPHSDNLQMLAHKLDVLLIWLLGDDDTFAKSLMSQLGQIQKFLVL
ncbi:helix-turn-helix domain-containing protein [Sneathiella sp.]|uniref:helix-turn-helix domain-containing protein n=1 Tax=Sneathiella sp. TaxID=1964365 RepID=UPI0035625578